MARRLLDIGQKNGGLAGHLNDMGIQSAAIYGMGYIGSYIFKDLLMCGYDVRYVIDKKEMPYLSAIDIDSFKIKDNLPKVDVIILTPSYGCDAIKKEIKSRYDYRMIEVCDL